MLENTSALLYIKARDFSGRLVGDMKNYRKSFMSYFSTDINKAGHGKPLIPN